MQFRLFRFRKVQTEHLQHTTQTDKLERVQFQAIPDMMRVRLVFGQLRHLEALQMTALKYWEQVQRTQLGRISLC